jgi:predicted nucleic acid-binding protein
MASHAGTLLIWSAAAENGVAMIDTADFQDGREIEGVRFINPFVHPTPPAP